MNNMWKIQFLRVFDEGILQYTVPIFAPNLCYFFLTFYPLQKTEVNTSPFYGKLFVIYIIKINRKIILINRLDFFAGCHYMQVLF